MRNAHCIKCKKKVVMVNPELVYYKNGVPAHKGTCQECGKQVLCILSKADREELINRSLKGEK